MSQSGKEWYKKQLKRPEWKELRQEVFKRDNYLCIECDNENRPQKGRAFLQCHHTYYVTNKQPWEYPLYAFESLCDACHEKRSAVQKFVSTEHSEQWILYLEAERGFIELELADRDARIDKIVEDGAEWLASGHCYVLERDGKSEAFDADGRRI